MRIQHNIMAMSAYRNYNTNTSAVAKNLEKLSSGYIASYVSKINLLCSCAHSSPVKNGISLVFVLPGTGTLVNIMIACLITLLPTFLRRRFQEISFVSKFRLPILPRQELLRQ